MKEKATETESNERDGSCRSHRIPVSGDLHAVLHGK